MNQSVLMLEATLPVLHARLSLTRDRSALVVDEAEQLVGIVTLEDINRAISVWEQCAKTSNPGCINFLSQQLGEICTTEILYAYTDEPLSEALDRMAARGLHQLPVVDRDNRLLGLLEREQIALICKVAVTRQALRHYLMSSKTEELPLPTLKQPAS